MSPDLEKTRSRLSLVLALALGSLLLASCGRRTSTGGPAGARADAAAIEAEAGAGAAAGPGVAVTDGPLAPAGIDARVNRSTWRWGAGSKGDCAGEGLRTITAPLRNLPRETDGLAICAQTPHNVMGFDYPAPDDCKREGGDIVGTWRVPDSSCSSTTTPPPRRGEHGTLTSPAPLEGFADLHIHQMGHLGFGGSVVWGGAYGPPAEVLGPIPPAFKRGHDMSEALVDGEILGGLTGLATHDEAGHPSFARWPSRDLATHQQAYEDWLFRAYQGGMRLMVMLAVNSEDMFGRGENDLPIIGNVAIQGDKLRGRSGNDMEALEWQVREAFRMQAHVDAKNGGPGKGWYRVVRSPEEASEVIRGGRLAVVLGTELQHLFNCDADRPACDETTITEGLDRLEAMGVHYVFPIHHKLNQFGGPAQFNPLTNGPTEDCHRTSEPCSAAGLTPLGRFLIAELMARGMMIDTEHLSWRAFDEALEIAEARSYPMMASHVGMYDLEIGDRQTEQKRTSEQLRRLFASGGMVGIIHGVAAGEYVRDRAGPVPQPISCQGADHFANAYLYLRDLARGGLSAAGGHITLGSDWNGFASWASPRFSAQPCERKNRAGAAIPKPAPIGYPLPLPRGLVPAAIGPVTSLSPMAEATFNYNTHGLMNVGLTPEFFEDLRLVGLSLEQLEPIYRSARGFVEIWRAARERVVPGDRHHVRWAPSSAFDLIGEPPPDARPDVLVATDVPICRARRGRQLGFLQQGRCVAVEGIGGVPPASASAISAYHAGRCLDVDGQSLRDGATVQQYACNGGSNQRFRIQSNAGGFHIVAESSGKCVAIDGAIAAGARISQQSCTDAPTQRFSVERVGNTFGLRAAGTELCLEVLGESRGNNAAVVLAPCSGAAHQRWSIESLRDDDHERLVENQRGRTRWGTGAPFPVPVVADSGRAICRFMGQGSVALGTVEGAVCVGRTLTGMSARSDVFESLAQVP